MRTPLILASLLLPLAFGQEITRTTSDRAVIPVPNGTLLLESNSSVRIDPLGRMELLSGSAVVVTEKAGIRVLCEDWVTLSGGGVFRMDLRPVPASPYNEKECRFRVYQGNASIQFSSFVKVLNPGEMMNLNSRCGDMIPWHTFDMAAEPVTTF